MQSFLYVNGGFSVVSIVLHGSNQRRSFDCISGASTTYTARLTLQRIRGLICSGRSSAAPLPSLSSSSSRAEAFWFVDGGLTALTTQVLPPRWNWLFAIVVGLLAVTSYCANVVANAYVWRAAGIYDDQLIAIVRALILHATELTAQCAAAFSGSRRAPCATSPSHPCSLAG